MHMYWDYAVFVIFVLASAAYPIWDERRGRSGVASKQSYVFATGRVSVFAIVMSLSRNTLGVRTIIGYPAELFYRGSAMFECLYGIVLAYPLVVWMFVPVYHRLEVTSVYEYLNMRFGSRLVRQLASATFIVRAVFNLAIIIYTPCVAMQTIMAVPFWASLLTLTGISICFAIFGGVKAAITADVIQGLTIIVVSIAVIIKGITLLDGGLMEIHETNRDDGRYHFLHVGDLTTRVDTVSATIGQAIIQISIVGCQQNLVQRYMSLKDIHQVRKALFTSVPVMLVLYTVPWLCGAVVYAVYARCDPRRMGYISKTDEIMPFFVLDKLLVIPGCVGLFLATLFNGALCIYVSNLNSLATVVWEDFLSQLPQFRTVTDANQLRAIKWLAVVFAWLAFGSAFLVGMLSGVIESAQMIGAATAGPLVGVFMLAMFVPIANWKGATVGMCVALAAAITWMTGFVMISEPDPFLQTSVEGCTNETFSPWVEHRNAVETSLLDEPAAVATALDGGMSVFKLSYMYYGVFGVLITMVVGTLVSLLTLNKSDVCEEKLLNPYLVQVRNWCRGERKTLDAKMTEIADGKKSKAVISKESV